MSQLFLVEVIPVIVYFIANSSLKHGSGFCYLFLAHLAFAERFVDIVTIAMRVLHYRGSQLSMLGLS